MLFLDDFKLFKVETSTHFWLRFYLFHGFSEELVFFCCKGLKEAQMIEEVANTKCEVLDFLPDFSKDALKEFLFCFEFSDVFVFLCEIFDFFKGIQLIC